MNKGEEVCDVEKNIEGSGVEGHHASQFSSRGAWLRALVLGSNDGLVSIASLLLGVSAGETGESRDAAVAGIAGLVAGACSMGLGEYVSVASQRDSEIAQRKQLGDEKHLVVAPLANPLQAALVSVASFTIGGAIPLLASVFLVSYKMRIIAIAVSTMIGLAAFGVIAAKIGGGNAFRAGTRVTLGGLIAMLITFGILFCVSRTQHGGPTD